MTPDAPAMRAGAVARAKRVAHDHVFQRKAGFKSQASGAQAADRARGDLDQDRAAVGFAPAQLGVDGAGLEAQRARRRRHRVGDAALIGRRAPRRRDVEGFLEGRAVERIGLVEQRQHLERAAGQDALQRELGPGDERFDEDLPGRVRIGPAQGGVGEQALEPRQRRRERGAIVGAHHAAAARQHQRLDDAGKADAGRRGHARGHGVGGSVPQATAKKRGCLTAGSAAAASLLRA